MIAATAPLYERATALMVEAIRARTDVARKLYRGSLRPAEAEKRYEAIKVKFAEAWAMRREALALKHTWLDRSHGRRED